MSQQITYSQLVSIIFKQLNKFRDNPRSMVPLLDKRIDQYQDKYYLYDGNSNVKILTEEGVKPVKQALNALTTIDKLPKFTWSYQLHCAANKRAHASSKQEQYNNKYINLSTLDDLIPDDMECSGEVSEHFVYGYCDPADIITNLLIDDGHPQRQNRQSLLNRELKYIGIGVEYHPKYMFVVVLILVHKIDKKQENIPRKHFNIFEEHRHGPVQQRQPIKIENMELLDNHSSQNQGSHNCQNCIIF